VDEWGVPAVKKGSRGGSEVAHGDGISAGVELAVLAGDGGVQ